MSHLLNRNFKTLKRLLKIKAEALEDASMCMYHRKSYLDILSLLVLFWAHDHHVIQAYTDVTIKNAIASAISF